MTAVAFTLFSRGATADEAHDKLSELVDACKDACKKVDLEIGGQYFLPSMNTYCLQGDTGFQGRAHLRIEKRKGITYNQIYSLVNTIQPTPFKIIREDN